ncbi:MAG: transcriptional repressor LexA [Clostridia bacterium]
MHNNDKKEKIYNFIINNYEETGIIPTVREIATAVNLKSTSSVQRYINLLQDEGLLNKSLNKKRSVLPNGFQKTVSIPIIGQVTAGVPILATENFEGYIPFPANKAKSGEHFALTIKGDSMKNVGILNGDTIIVKKTSYAENGDIIVALIEDEATVKRFYKENGHYRLQPENDCYKPIITKSLDILGKVVSSIRYY